MKEQLIATAMRHLLPISALLVTCLTGIDANAQTNDVIIHLSQKAEATLNSDPWWDWGMFFSTTLGGLAAGAVGVWLNRHAHSLDKKRADDEEKDFQANLLRAVRMELESIQRIFDTGIGSHFSPSTPPGPVHVKLGLTLNWFSVFEANASHLGRIEGRLSRSMIAVYLGAKRVIEELRINNSYVDEYRSLRDDYTPPPSHLQKRQANLVGLMVEQRARIEDVTESVKQEASKFFKMLDDEGIV